MHLGSIRKLAGGSYEARYRDPYGRSRSKTFRTKGEARSFLTHVESTKQTNSWVDPQRARIRFAVWAEEERKTWADLRPATRARADSLMRSHVLPEFGDAPLGIITPLGVQAWVNELVAQDLSSSTVHGCYRLLSRVMSAAVRSELISHSPCREITLPRPDHTEMKFLTAEELHRLADASGSFRPLILSAGYLGLRWGELAGLRRKRFNPLKGTIEVVEILTEVAGRLDFGPPKTKASRRQIALPSSLTGLLRDNLDAYPSGPNDLVFVGRDGAPLRRTNFRKRHWLPSLERAGLPSAVRFHDLRHTCAALLIAQGAHPKEIQARLGHSSITTTLDRYGHLLPSLDERLRDGLDLLFQSQQGGTNLR